MAHERHFSTNRRRDERDGRGDSRKRQRSRSRSRDSLFRSGRGGRDDSIRHRRPVLAADPRDSRDSRGGGGGGDRRHDARGRRSRSRSRDRDLRKPEREHGELPRRHADASNRQDHQHHHHHHHHGDIGGGEDGEVVMRRDEDAKPLQQRAENGKRGDGGGSSGVRSGSAKHGGANGGNYRGGDSDGSEGDDDVVALEMDEEEEEQRLAEERRKRLERLQALSAKAAPAAASTAAPTAAAGAAAAPGARPALAAAAPRGTDGTAAAAAAKPAEQQDSDEEYSTQPLIIAKSGGGGGRGGGGGSGAAGSSNEVGRSSRGSDGERMAPGDAGAGNRCGGPEKDDEEEAAAPSVAPPPESHAVRGGPALRPVFDMFSASPSGGLDGAMVPGRAAAGDAASAAADGSALAGAAAAAAATAAAHDPSLQSNWTAEDGYYKSIAGELIADRYRVLGGVGRGVFSTVLKCIDTRPGAGPTGGAAAAAGGGGGGGTSFVVAGAGAACGVVGGGIASGGGVGTGGAAIGGGSGVEVALKFIRNNDLMRKNAQKEVAILQDLRHHDPHNRKHCVRLLDTFEHRGHTVMVFEALQMNLRETLRKFGNKVGINAAAVRTYAKQLFSALRHLEARRVVHADIKLDNIVVSEGFGVCKLCDFGSAFREGEPDGTPTPYLVSRWYRAPEIILGLDCDRALDTWSVATTLFELFVGKPMLPGKSNNEMLKLMMGYKGAFPKAMLRQHVRAYAKINAAPHFDDAKSFAFVQHELDPISKHPTMRHVVITAPTRNVRSELLSGKGGEDERDTVIALADLLERCLALDPRRRPTIAEAFDLPFLRR